MTICSNGWVSFIETWQNDFTNWNIPAALGPYAMLAPYWDDLKGLMTAPGTWDPVKVRYYHDQQNNRFIIDWKDTYNGFNNSSLEKFQIILYPKNNSDDDIVFQYHTIDNHHQITTQLSVLKTIYKMMGFYILTQIFTSNSIYFNSKFSY